MHIISFSNLITTIHVTRGHPSLYSQGQWKGSQLSNTHPYLHKPEQEHPHHPVEIRANITGMDIIENNSYTHHTGAIGEGSSDWCDACAIDKCWNCCHIICLLQKILYHCTSHQNYWENIYSFFQNIPMLPISWWHRGK